MPKTRSKTHLSKAGRHILLTRSRPADNGNGGAARAYSGFVALSDRLVENAFLAGISPQLAPGLVVGDYLVACSDYTGTANDPYPGAGAAPVALLGNMVLTPVFFQIYAALTAAVPAVTATRGDGATVTLHTPEGLSGSVGGQARVDVLPESAAGWGTSIFRIVRITSVPANPAQAYSGDIYELGVTVDDAQLLVWGMGS